MTFQFTINPQSQTVQAGENIRLTARASGAEHIAYYWKYTFNHGSAGIPFNYNYTTEITQYPIITEGEDSLITETTTYLVNALLEFSLPAVETVYVTCSAVDLDNNVTIISSVATITATMPVPYIYKQPQSGIYEYEQTKQLAVGASVTAGALSYQWQIKDNNDTWQNIAGATSSVLAVTQLTGIEYYRCRVTNTLYGQTSTATSSIAWVSVRTAETKTTSDTMAYVLSYVDLSMKDYFRFDAFSFVENIDFAEKSQISLGRVPNIISDDYVLCKKGNQTVFFGLCEDFSTSDESVYTINLCQKEGMFDRSIFLENESAISSTGIEDFIAGAIEDNWIDSGDALLDRSYMTVTASTHTPLNIAIEADSGVYNFRDFLSYCREYYGIFVDFEVENNALNLTVRKDSASTVLLDALVSDISDYAEVYDVDVMARLFVKWKNKSTEVVTSTAYYLMSDGTLTTDKTAITRISGITKSIYLEASSVDEVYQKAVDEFKGASYEHKISFNLNNDSLAYPVADYYVGRTATIRTKTGTKANSLVTSTTKTSESNYTAIICGKLKVTLIEKLRRL